ncbi:SRPBCC family protein [Paramicrobacterium fandaimingii]|uniref:SRPBCC family protein n=1 Tax=Paramicrobacterium fandaimingii TaxID=2708079 RepID=UPI00142463CE|nr:SRPBCC family protein [Microbacterium fandaimingii]
MPDISRSLEISAPPTTVWKWFTTQEMLRQWLRPDIVIDLVVGGDYRMLGSDGTTISGVVLELVPEKRLVLSWLEEGTGWKHPARLVVELEPTSGGTRATLTHDGFAGIGTPGWQSTAESYRRGLSTHRVLEGLAEVVQTRA